MNYQDTILKETILMRVRFIHTVKNVGALFVAKLALFSGLVALAGFFVSVPHVLQNMPSLFEIKSFTQFAMMAFLNTKTAIQAITLGTLTLLLWMVGDLIKIFRVTPFLKTA